MSVSGNPALIKDSSLVLQLDASISNRNNKHVPFNNYLPASGLLGYWPLTESSGTRYDISGNGNHLLQSGTVGSSTDFINGQNTANFTGDGSYLYFPAGLCDVAPDGGEKTYSIWFKTPVPETYYQWIWMQGTGSDYTDINPMYIEGSYYLNMLFQTDAGSYWNSNFFDPPDPANGLIQEIPGSKWQHVAVRFSNESGTTYCTQFLNGVQTNKFAYDGNVQASGSSFTLGVYTAFPGPGGFGNNFIGSMSNVGLWSRALTNNEIYNLYGGVSNKLWYDNSRHNNHAELAYLSSYSDTSRGSIQFSKNSIVNYNGTSISGSGASIGNPVSTNINNISVGAWFKTTNIYIRRQMVIFNGDDTPGGASGYGFSVNNENTNDGSLLILFAGIDWIDTGIKLQSNVWYYVVLNILSNGTYECYLNGNKVFSGNSYTPYTPTIATYIGSNNYPTIGNNFNGEITAVHFYNRSLAAAEILQNYNQFKNRYSFMPQPASSLVTDGSLQLLLDATNSSSYPGSGGSWYDISGNGNNFNVNGSAWQNPGLPDGPYFDFKGSYGCAKTSSGSDVPLSGDVTVCAVTRLSNNVSDWRTLIRSFANPGDHQVIVATGTNNIGMYDHVNSSGFISSGYSAAKLPGYDPTLDSSVFMVMIWRWLAAGDTFWEMIVNGLSLSKIATGYNNNINAQFNNGIGSIGAYHNYVTFDPNDASQFWGDIKYFAAYNRYLSDAEVQQNTSYLRGRFNI